MNFMSFPAYDPTDQRASEMRFCKDSAFTASSYLSSDRKPHYSNMAKPNAWTPKQIPKEEFVTITFAEAKFVKCITTRGCGGKTSLEYVTSYTLKYSPDNTTWRYVTDADGRPKVFQGNSDNRNNHTNTLETAVWTYGVRLYPRGFVGDCALRWGVFEDCNIEGTFTHQKCLNNADLFVMFLLFYQRHRTLCNQPKSV